jgi:hypothetical protein
MGMARIFRRFVMAVVVVGAGGIAASHPDAIKAFYEDIYPSDPAKREALDLCFMHDHKFNRLDPSQREACYGSMLLPRGELSSAPAPADRPNVNLVDLQRAAAQGSMPHNDIRRAK